MLVEGAGEVDVDQLSVVERQTQDLTSEPKVIQVIWVHRGVTVGLEGGPCRWHPNTGSVDTRVQVLTTVKVAKREKSQEPSADWVKRA